MKKISALLLLVICLAACNKSEPINYDKVKPTIEFAPQTYTCLKVEKPINIDGNIYDKEWSQAPWTNYYNDIEGDLKPKPYRTCRTKMLWDNNYFYFAAELEEPHIWANLTQRDAVIFHDNDWEIFLDPDNDTHNYYEYEVNALGTVWDLFIDKPYRDGKDVAHNEWDINGLKTKVKLYGTINDPSDKDEKWTVEVAIPWDQMKKHTKGGMAPEADDFWRVNFSRVQWRTEIKNGKYVKLKGEDGKNLPEHNWSWSAQGHIAMHMPERWGFVFFSNSSKLKEAKEYKLSKEESIKWCLRRVYYAQHEYRRVNKKFTDNQELLLIDRIKLDSKVFNPTIKLTKNGFEASYDSICIREDGKVYIK